jgi:hypothetical protein
MSLVGGARVWHSPPARYSKSPDLRWSFGLELDMYVNYVSREFAESVSGRCISLRQLGRSLSVCGSYMRDLSNSVECVT